MNLQDINPLAPKFEPGRPVYVLLHEDRSHIYPSPDGQPAWSYDESKLKITQAILRKEFGNFDYHVCLLSVAWPLLCNTQAELEKVWQKTITQIRAARKVHDRIVIYRNFMKRTRRPHPISVDGELKQLLGLK